MSTAIAKQAPSLPVINEEMGLRELGEILAKSGFFKDTRDAAQACVKVLFGRELGVGPVTAMTGIHIIEGRPQVGAHLIAAAIKRSGRYDYRVTRHDEQGCEITFLLNGAELGRYAYTMADAARAGLGGRGPWKAHPRSMLFARAIGQGYRTHCPDVFSMPVYAEGEIEDEIRVEVIDKPAPRPEPNPREARRHNDEALHTMPEAIPDVQTPFERSREEFPELGPDYTLDPSDYGAAYTENQKAHDHADIKLSDAHTWQEHCERTGKASWKQRTARERALILWAHELRTTRKAAEEAAHTAAIEDAARLEITIAKAHELMPDPKRRAMENYTIVELQALAAARNAELQTIGEKRQNIAARDVTGPMRRAAKKGETKTPTIAQEKREQDRRVAAALATLADTIERHPPGDRRGRLLELAQRAEWPEGAINRLRDGAGCIDWLADFHDDARALEALVRAMGVTEAAA